MGDFFDLTDASQKEVSRLAKLLTRQTDIMEKEKIIQQNSTNEETYVSKRAKKTLESSERKLEESHDTYKIDQEKMETAFKEASKKHESDLAKLERDYKENIKKLEALIAEKESIIEEEFNKKKSLTYKNAEAEAILLKQKIDAIKGNKNNYHNPEDCKVPQATPLTQAPKPEPEPEEEEKVTPPRVEEKESEDAYSRGIRRAEEAEKNKKPFACFESPVFQYQSERMARNHANPSTREDMPYVGEKSQPLINPFVPRQHTLDANGKRMPKMALKSLGAGVQTYTTPRVE